MTASAPRPTGDDVLRLVEEAAAVEREACAKLADELARRWRGFPAVSAQGLVHGAKVELAEQIAAQIRARGNPK